MCTKFKMCIKFNTSFSNFSFTNSPFKKKLRSALALKHSYNGNNSDIVKRFRGR